MPHEIELLLHDVFEDEVELGRRLWLCRVTQQTVVQQENKKYNSTSDSDRHDGSQNALAVNNGGIVCSYYIS